MSLLLGLGLAGSAISGLVNAGTSMYNIGQQRQQYRYEQGLQQQIFEREDNAVQRRVEDLRAAGLSPTLAAGQAAKAGQAISVNAPQARTDYKFELMTKGLQLAQMEMGMLQMKKDIAKTDAETSLIRLRQGEQNLKNKYLDQSLTSRVSVSRSQAQQMMHKVDQVQLDNEMTRLNISGKAIENLRSQIAKEFAEYELSYKEQLTMAKLASAELARAGVAEKNYNLEWFKKMGLPTGQQLPAWMKSASVVGSAGSDVVTSDAGRQLIEERYKAPEGDGSFWSLFWENLMKSKGGWR